MGGRDMPASSGSAGNEWDVVVLGDLLDVGPDFLGSFGDLAAQLGLIVIHHRPEVVQHFELVRGQGLEDARLILACRGRAGRELGILGRKGCEARAEVRDFHAQPTGETACGLQADRCAFAVQALPIAGRH